MSTSSFKAYYFRPEIVQNISPHSFSSSVSKAFSTDYLVRPSARPFFTTVSKSSAHVSLEHIFVIIFLTSDSLTDNLINVTLGMSRNRESMACYACIGQSFFLRALVSQLPEKLSYIYSEHSRKKVNIITAFFSLIILNSPPTFPPPLLLHLL